MQGKILKHRLPIRLRRIFFVEIFCPKIGGAAGLSIGKGDIFKVNPGAGVCFFLLFPCPGPAARRRESLFFLCLLFGLIKKGPHIIHFKIRLMKPVQVVGDIPHKGREPRNRPEIQHEISHRNLPRSHACDQISIGNPVPEK